MIAEFQGEYRWLSNFWPCNVRMPDGITYPSAEHAFQAYKALDLDKRKQIAMMGDAREAKKFGKAVDLRPDYQRTRLMLMATVVYLKFAQNAELRALLLETADKELVEGNWWNDVYWGVCNGEGENWLGKILMGVRGVLVEGFEQLCFPF